MKAMHRRDLLRLLGRGAVFGGLGLLAGLLAGRSGDVRETPCTGDRRCGACPALPDCRLPRGLSARSVLRNSHEVKP